MYEYIKGNIVELTPTFVVIDNNNIGYHINISLNTYSKIEQNKEAQLFIHFIVREDAQLFFGFADIQEREMFRLLLSVSGVGANTARMIFSSMSPNEVAEAIRTSNIVALKSVKGIGAKSAERIIVDLKDKVGLDDLEATPGVTDSGARSEAISALVMLGFNKKTTEKVVAKILKVDSSSAVEVIIKQALKQL